MKKILIPLYIVCSLFIISVLSCKNDTATNTEKIEIKSPEDLYEKYKKAVVLVYRGSYYSVKIGTREVLLGLDESESGLTIYENTSDVREHLIPSYGTGFFINDNGLIATNRHVAAGKINDNTMSQIFLALERFSMELESKVESYNEELEKLSSDFVIDNSGTTDYSRIDQLNRDIKEMQTFRDYINNVSENDVSVKNLILGVGYEDNSIENTNNLDECDLVKISNKEEVDLALIQLKSKKTPEFVTSYFTFDEHNPNILNAKDSSVKGFDIENPVKVKTNVYMIGYNGGLDLAKGHSGKIKPQLTQGYISQETDGFRVMYTIPSLQGSSGSPVVDEWGNLVAVNYAGITNTQSFNYGVLSLYLKRMVEGNERYKPTVAKPTASANVTKEGTSEEADKIMIQDFFEAENARNFEYIYSFFSKNLEQYWDLTKPNKEVLKKRYQTSWSKTKSSHNEITSIQKVNNNIYTVSLDYSFTNNTDEQKSVTSKLKIVLDDARKIKYINALK